MVTRNSFVNELLKRSSDWQYDKENDTLYYKDIQVNLDELYEKFLLKCGMSFNCICDIHWECMSILECKKCGTVIRYYYDEFYEPNFRCPVCTDYKTGYEYYTKDEVNKNEDLQAIIEMYRDLDRIQKEQHERSKKRNGLSDNELCKSRIINTKNHAYKFQLLINSITNKNKFSGLRLHITKYDRDDDGLVSSHYTEIPLSINAIRMQHRIHEVRRHPELDSFNNLMGKSISQHLEENAVKVRRRERT